MYEEEEGWGDKSQPTYPKPLPTPALSRKALTLTIKDTHS